MNDALIVKLAAQFKRLGQLAIFLVGVSLLVFGIWQMSRPVGTIAAGLALCVLALMSRNRGP